MAKPTLTELYPNFDDTDGGVFKDLAGGYASTFAWLDDAALLDIEYYGNHSGEKTASPLLCRYSGKNTTPPLTSTQRGKIADIIAAKFENKWTRLYALLGLDYNPIENYSMIETETPNLTRRDGVSADFEEKREHAVDTFLSTTNTNDASNGIYGFNSSVPVPSAEAGGVSSSVVAGSGAENKEVDTTSQTGYREQTETGTRTLTRSGNIGVTTSQQMAQSEIDLWKWNFYDQVFRDIDEVLTINKYDFEKGEM